MLGVNKVAHSRQLQTGKQNTPKKPLAKPKDPEPGKKDSNHTFYSITAILEEHSQLSFSAKEVEYFNLSHLWSLEEVHNGKNTSEWFLLSRRQTPLPTTSGILPYFPNSIKSIYYHTILKMDHYVQLC